MRGFAARLEMGLDDLGEMMGVDDDLLHADGAEAVDHRVDHRLAGDRHHRLRHGVGERPQARAEAGGQHHGAAAGWPRRGSGCWRGALLRALSATSCAEPRALRAVSRVIFAVRVSKISSSCGRTPRGSGDMAIEPGAHRRQRRMGEVIFDSLQTRGMMLQIAGLAVAQQEAGEGAEDARVALGADDGVAGIEGFAVEIGKRGEVALAHGRDEIGRHVAAHILQQRDQIEGARGDQGVLEIEQAAGGDAAGGPGSSIRLSTW